MIYCENSQINFTTTKTPNSRLYEAKHIYGIRQCDKFSAVNIQNYQIDFTPKIQNYHIGLTVLLRRLFKVLTNLL